MAQPFARILNVLPAVTTVVYATTARQLESPAHAAITSARDRVRSGLPTCFGGARFGPYQHVTQMDRKVTRRFSKRGRPVLTTFNRSARLLARLKSPVVGCAPDFRKAWATWGLCARRGTRVWAFR